MSNESDVYNNMDIGLYTHILYILYYTRSTTCYKHFLHSLPIMAYLFVISNNNVLFGSIFIHTHSHNHKYMFLVYNIYIHTSLIRTV